MLASELVKYVVAFFVPIVYLIYRQRTSPVVTTAVPAAEDNKRPLKSVMQAPREDLAPPKDDPFTNEELRQYDGSDSSKPIYVAIKGGFLFYVCS
jgi:membrane-associated progesterone receptor component